MNGDWWRLLFEGDVVSGAASGETALLILLFAFVIGQFIGWVYMWTHTGLSYSQSYVASLVALPVIIALMMVLMAGSVIVAFGLLAVFAVVRFRNVLKDTRDTTFVLWAILEGLAVGTMRYSTALIAAAGVGLVLAYLRVTSFGSRHRFDAVLSLQLEGDLSSLQPTLRGILDAHCARAMLTSEQQTGPSSRVQSYRVLLRDPSRSQDLRSLLEQTQGMNDVTLYLRVDEGEV